MLMTISTTHNPATDLGYLLHKNPNRLFKTDISVGVAHVFYPEATAERCTAALVLEIDPVRLVRRQDEHTSHPLEPYINDRPYVASSFLSVALARVFSTAMAGRSKDRQALADSEIPLEVVIPTLPCRGGESFLRSLFEPLGYHLVVEEISLDVSFPEWGPSEYFHVTLQATKLLRDVLAHLNVLIPVLDNNKHYWVGDDEVAKLIMRGEGWLRHHPQSEEISRRYLKGQHRLLKQALSELIEGEDESTPQKVSKTERREAALEKKLNLNAQRLQSVADVIALSGVSSVVDLGCGEGNLLRVLLENKQLKRIVGMDVSARELEIAARRLEVGTNLSTDRLNLIQGSLIYRDDRLKGFEAATLIEVIEHLEPNRLDTLSRVVFESARPQLVVVTTPNVEYNVNFPNLPNGEWRHPDHRFEWTRGEFASWCEKISRRFGYNYSLSSVGHLDLQVGAPTQMAVFKL